jgi:hypothetical protein
MIASAAADQGDDSKNIEQDSSADNIYTLNYFEVWAKGPPCAFALTFSGLPWKGCGTEYMSSPEGLAVWFRDKPSTTWGALPTLTGPVCGTIGQELAILNFVASICPKMGGATPAEFCTSQQLMLVAEDILSKMYQFTDTPIFKCVKTKEEREAFWGASVNSSEYVHSARFGINMYLSQLEKFYCTCNAGQGKYTSSGTTVGECKVGLFFFFMYNYTI